MTMKATEKLGMPEDLEKVLRITLACELMLWKHEGAVPSHLKPLLEEIYSKIAARSPAESVNASLRQFLAILEASLR